jgi:serine/threonine protein kinase/Flp pilus assembly protein TadD
MLPAGTVSRPAPHHAPPGGESRTTPEPRPAALAGGADRPREPAAVGDLYEVATSFQQVHLRGAAAVESWRDSLPKDSPHVDLFLELHRSDPEAAHRLAEAVTTMPEVGSDFLGFRLVAELGRGALGRAFLARQGDLADRPVVLKVSPDSDGETLALAQLQHTNVVPIYSAHRAGPLQALCMPYFGATTLAHVLKGLRGREALPGSGEGLVSTLVDRKGSTRPGAATDHPAAPAGPADAPPAPATALDRLQKLSYVEAVLWVGARLADGLAHAHERGILHRDIKPANILLGDDGEPMLLDFNLAQDTKSAAGVAAAQVGGTLPFMAPEQLQAYQAQTCALNFGSDIYSLGVILYELLTGRHPFPTHCGPIKQILERMIDDRLRPPPRLRCWNRAVSPAAESIVRRCLEPDPARRYRSARELQEDLERQLAHRPLRHAPNPSWRERARKWVRRHPRLASSTTAAALAAVVVVALAGALALRGQRIARLEAAQTLSRFDDEKRSAQFLLTARGDDAAQLQRGVESCRAALATYRVLDDPAWQDATPVRLLPEADRGRLREDVARLLVLLARATAVQARAQDEAAGRGEGLRSALRLNELAGACLGPEAARSVWEQRSQLAGLLGREAEAREFGERAARAPAGTGVDRYLAAAERVSQNRLRDALAILREATEHDPQDFEAWFLTGVCHDRLAQYAESAACYTTCLALSPKSVRAYFNRGLARHRQQDYRAAAADFDQALRLKPDYHEAHTNRALARQGLKDYAGAVEDLTRALELGAPATTLYFLRSTARERAGDADGARRDREEGLRGEPTDEHGWVARGYARMAGEPGAALADFDRALRLNPQSLAALQNKSHVLGRLGRNAEAAAALDRAVELYPDFVKARAGRGVILARLGRRDEALRDAAECRRRDGQPLTLYQLAGIYALTSRTNPEDRAEAFRLLGQALRQGVGFDLLERDRDLDPVRPSPEFRELVAAARVIRAGGPDTKPRPE